MSDEVVPTNYFFEVLKNGLTLIAHRLPHAKTVAFEAAVDAGSIYETNETLGAAHLLEHLHMECAQHYDKPAICRSMFDEFPGYLNAGTGTERAHYIVLTDSQHASLAIQMLASILPAKNYERHMIEAEKRILANELGGQQQSRYPFLAMFHKNHPLAAIQPRVVKSICALSLQTIQDLDNRLYAPQRTVVAMTGAFSFAQLDEARAELGAWQGVAQTPLVASFELRIPAKKRFVSTAVAVGNKPVSLELGFVSRMPSLGCSLSEWSLHGLFTGIHHGVGKRLRYGKSKIYDFTFDYHQIGSQFVAAFEAKTPSGYLFHVLREICMEIGRLRDGLISEADLRRVHAQNRSYLAPLFESPFPLANYYANADRSSSGNPVKSIDEIWDQVDNITCDDICRYARRMFPPDNYYLRYQRQWFPIRRRRLKELMSLAGLIFK